MASPNTYRYNDPRRLSLRATKVFIPTMSDDTPEHPGYAYGFQVSMPGINKNVVFSWDEETEQLVVDRGMTAMLGERGPQIQGTAPAQVDPEAYANGERGVSPDGVVGLTPWYTLHYQRGTLPVAREVIPHLYAQVHAGGGMGGMQRPNRAKRRASAQAREREAKRLRNQKARDQALDRGSRHQLTFSDWSLGTQSSWGCRNARTWAKSQAASA